MAFLIDLDDGSYCEYDLYAIERVHELNQVIIANGNIIAGIEAKE